ncbi:hypothetical protein [uncultured Amnibacterium sp.]|uniref:hypothetical protein n=1 Tax=uncultured Amnibacterium sp. TaxID=1631851 RepID=UPI0035CBB792
MPDVTPVEAGAASAMRRSDDAGMLVDIGAAVHQFSAQLDAELRHSVHLNHFELLLLQAVAVEHDGASIRHLTSALHCSHQRASIAVRRLARRGLLRTGRRDGTRSGLVSVLTPKGHTEIESATVIYVDLIDLLLREHRLQSSFDTA